MSLTVLYRGQNIRFAMRLSKPLWITILVLFSLLCGSLAHYFLTPSVPERALVKNIVTEHALTNKNPELTKQQLAALTLKLADMQSHVLRLNALGERLASQADIPEEEFNFSQLPPAGGPNELTLDFSHLSLTELVRKVETLQSQISKSEKQLEVLESLSLGHYIEDNSYLSGRPIKRGWLSSYYGVRK
jgi:hypothetical protein